MLTQPITAPRAWRADTIDDPAAWRYRLPDGFLSTAAEIIRDLPRRPEAIAEVPERLRLAGAQAMAPVRVALEEGRGFVIVGGVPPERKRHLVGLWPGA